MFRLITPDGRTSQDPFYTSVFHKGLPESPGECDHSMVIEHLKVVPDYIDYCPWGGRQARDGAELGLDVGEGDKIWGLLVGVKEEFEAFNAVLEGFDLKA